MSGIVTLDIAGWHPPLAPGVRESAVRAIEDGGVLVLPHVNFALSERERRFLSPEWSDGRSKNISLDGTRLKGARGAASDLSELKAMVDRFAVSAADLVCTLFPRYAPYVQRARTSFRPQPAVGRQVSWRKDDSRLHVDAFPSRPNHGERILRVFSNINPAEARVWRVGEPFEAVAKTFLPRIKDPLPGSAAILAALRVTKQRRSAYDHLMLNLHDRAKEDMAYQRDCQQEVVHFAPGTTWLCFSDQVMHAAVSGQFMLEQTIHLPVSALYDSSKAPLAILERLTGRALA
ncbi:MAG TPA: Kdo hydroxylase family protein [Casimicrobiaceae bacterium]|nr:Kdo hydroxylase family protein [Casimicrobiaceae bacterium]